jgi:hypothetical protein
MKLAQLLKLRSDTRKQVHSLAESLKGSAAVRIGALEYLSKEEIAEMADVAGNTRKQLTAKLDHLADITATINLTNAKHMVEHDGNGMTLAEAIARRDTFLLEADLLSRTVRLNGKWLIDQKKLRRIHDNAARQARELDDLIQQANWQIDVGGGVVTRD